MADTFTTFQDAFETLNPGTGGPTLDASAPARQDGAVRHRQRIVICGDADATAIIDPVKVDGHCCLPTLDEEAGELLMAILKELRHLNDIMSRATSQLPPDREGDEV